MRIKRPIERIKNEVSYQTDAWVYEHQVSKPIMLQIWNQVSFEIQYQISDLISNQIKEESLYIQDDTDE